MAPAARSTVPEERNANPFEMRVEAEREGVMAYAVDNGG
jgi:hypothetical protein